MDMIDKRSAQRRHDMDNTILAMKAFGEWTPEKDNELRNEYTVIFAIEDGCFDMEEQHV